MPTTSQGMASKKANCHSNLTQKTQIVQCPEAQTSKERIGDAVKDEVGKIRKLFGGQEMSEEFVDILGRIEQLGQ